MFRGSIVRTAKTVSRLNRLAPAAFRSAVVSGIRLNSTQPPNAPAEQSAKPPKTPEQIAKRAALEAEDELQRDWDPKLIISYEHFLPKTQNPSPVRVLTHD